MNKQQLSDRITELVAENAKLRRINHALIERVESGQTHSNDPYAAFQHSVILAEQVRERTDALNNALSELKVSHQALRKANAEAASAHQLLSDAIESISDAFVLFDADSRIVLFNQKFHNVWQGFGIDIAPGTKMHTLSQLAMEHQVIKQPEHHLQDTEVLQLYDGRWIQKSERPTSDGGLVVLYTDITKLKAQETQVREKALAHKSYLLHRAVESLSQGVVLVNPEGKLELWNSRFQQLSGISLEHLQQQPAFTELLTEYKSSLLIPLETNNQQILAAESEHQLDTGLVIAVRTHPMPDGGFINTYTDITERHQHAETLKQSEHWIRLITDHIPAMIAYVDSDLTFSFTNKVYDEWYGWPRGALNGMQIQQAHGEAQYAELRPYIKQALSGHRATFEIEEPNRRNSMSYMLKSYVPNLSPDGQAIGFFVLIQDITEQRKTASELTKAYQLMEQRVNDRTSELVMLNAQLRSEIDERRAIENRLREANKDAEQANLSKTKFLAAVSHDLLQPLNAARLFTGALIDQPLPDKPQQLAQSLSHSLEDVESLLGTLVDISKLDAGVVEPDISVFPINELLQNLANEYRQIAQSEQLSFAFHSSKKAIRTDSQLLARILRNFLSNAIRYTEQGRVVLGVRQQGDALLIQVWDTGVGIPKEKLTEIFQEFRRLPDGQLRQDKALGLGLAIVEKISRVLKHPIQVQSREGIGSVFSVQVPCASLDERPPLPQGPSLANLNQQLKHARIWVLDNDPAICNGMEQLLSSWGCDVITALSLDDLLEKTQQAQQTVDLVIADYHLDDDQNGLDAVSELIKTAQQQLPVLMITANHCQELKQQIRERGFMMMNKPVKPLKLKTMLSHLIS